MARNNRELDSKKQRDSSPSKKTGLPRRNKAGKYPVITARRTARLAHAAINTNRRGAVPVAIPTRSAMVDHDNRWKRNPSRNSSKSPSSGKRNPVRNKKVRNPK